MPPAESPRRRRAAFTLVEVLTVVAIVATLTGILFPAFAQARERARRTACLSNVKMLGYATLAYAQDHDETFPMSVYPLSGADENGHLVPGSGGRTATAYDALLPYLRSRDVLLCPDYPDGAGGADFEARLIEYGLTGSGEVTHAAYAWNFALFQDPAAGPLYDAADPVVALSDLPAPADTTLFYDTRSFEASITIDPAPTKEEGAGIGPGNVLDGGPTEGTGDGPPFDWYLLPGHARHGGGLNIGFVDGHVRWVKEDGELPGDSPASAADPTPVPTYTVPFDLSGIPGGERDT